MRAVRTSLSGLVSIYLLSLVVAVATHAGAPKLINYQGQLNTSGGSPVPDATYSVTFTIYDAAVGGLSLWTETQSVTTSDGQFSVLLGTITPVGHTVFSDLERYLGIQVAADPEMTPRTRLVSVPYALRVHTIDGAEGGAITGDILTDNSSSTTGIMYKDGERFLHNLGGISNTFLGYQTGNFTLTGFFNTGIGRWALLANTSGNSNVAVGVDAMLNNTTGFSNTALGVSAMKANIGGVANTAVGNSAMALTTSGQQNTAVGQFALQDNTTGNFNTAIGQNADVTSGALSNATAIGFGAQVNASNKIRLGNASVTVLECQVGLTVVSDSAAKENFHAVDGDKILEKIDDLSVQSWNYKGHDPEQFRHYGPIAQEFYEAFGNDGVGTVGSPTTINSQDLDGVMLAAIQTLARKSAQVETLKGENQELRKEMDALKALVADLAARISNASTTESDQK